MATANSIKELEYMGYLIRIRELIEEIERTSANSSPSSIAILSFPREHLSIQKPDGDFLTAREIISLLKKGIDKHESKNGSRQCINCVSGKEN